MKKYIVAILLLSFSFNQEIFSGYLRSTEASFCMDECGMFYVESEYDSGAVQTEYPLYFDEDIEFESYLNRFVEVTVSDDEVNCIECSALRVLRIELSDDCIFPVDCFADPCDVAEECQLNTPVDCVSNFCGGCYSDFYDLEGDLVNCFNEEDDNDGEPNPCSDFSQEDCEWFDECVWTDSGCQDFDWEDDSENYCEGLSEDECFEADGCVWEYSNNMPSGGLCTNDEQDFDECSDIDNQYECEYIEGCEWEDSSSNNFGYCVDGDENEDDNGPPECLLDCEGIEFINPEENPYETCDWVISNFGPNNFFNECAEDCSNETIMEINEYVELCFECLSDNNCDEIFDDEDEQDSECLDFDNEEDCRLNECEWQLNPAGIGECVEGGSFEPVCEDLSDAFFGWCEMIIGVGWNGEDCVWFSGCGTVDENNGIDYAGAFYESIEDCQAVCLDNQQGNGYLYGSVEYIWGDAIEMVAGAIVVISSPDGFFTTQTNEQGYYSIEIPQGEYLVSVEAYNESQTQDIYIEQNQEYELNFQFGDWYYPSVLMGRVLCADCDQESMPISEADIVISNPNNLFVFETFSDEEGYFFADLPASGMYNVMISKNGYSDYAEYVLVEGYTDIDFYLNVGSSGADGYAVLSLENITTSPGNEVSQGLFLESDLEVGGLQFSIYTEDIGSSNHILEAGISSMNDCFSASSNYLDGTFIGIIFSLEGCTYPANEQIHVADLNYYISDNTPLGLDIMMNFENTLVSDPVGNEILSYGEGAYISLGILGDVNSDADINILDVISIVNFAIYIEEPTDSEFWAADLNSDNMLDILDIVIIVNMILDN